MQIVFVDWRIIKGREDEFKEYWKTKVPVDDRSLMAGEFLSEPTVDTQFPWIT